MAQEGHDWTGFYYGGHVGVGSLATNANANFFFIDGGEGDFNVSGGAKDKDRNAFAGFQFGYNIQISQFVFGPVVQASFGDFGKSNLIPTDGGEGAFALFKPSLNAWAIFGGKAGVAFGNFYVYGLSGVVVSDLKVRFTSELGSFTEKNKYGYMVGGGGEYAITQFISLFFEGQYIDFGSVKGGLVDGGEGFTAGFSGKAKTDLKTVKVGFNIKF